MGKLTCWVVGLPVFLFGIGNNVTVHFSVHDDGGNAVTNAEIKARTRRDRLEFWTHANTPMRETIVRTDALGTATARFPCYSGDFDCFVSAPGFYSEILRYIHFKIRGDSVGYARLLEHEKDVSLTLRRKRNPIPMYCDQTGYSMNIPAHQGSFGFDMKRRDWVKPYGTGETVDFLLEYRFVETNGTQRYEGALCFQDEKSGAYRLKKYKTSGDFCSVYEADTNGVYRNRFEFVREASKTGLRIRSDLLNDDEYFVLRTRVRVDDKGRILSANYSKIYGMFAIDRILYFRESFFNPTPNDPNLEYNGENLAPRRR